MEELKEEYTYAELLDNIKPSLEALADIEYGEKTPISHILNVAENLDKIEGKAKLFLDTRKKLLDGYVEKDSKGNPKTKVVEGREEYVLTNANKNKWNARFEELRNEKVELELAKINREHLEGVKIKPNHIRGCLRLLE